MTEEAVVTPVDAATPVEKKKRKRKSGSKGRSKGIALASPEGGWKTADEVYAAGFVRGKHNRPKPSEFADVLESARFDARYYKDEVLRAEKRVTDLEALGSTAEERKAKLATQKVVDSVADVATLGNLSPSQLEQLALIIAAAQAKAAS